jgi:hypothetical protein
MRQTRRFGAALAGFAVFLQVFASTVFGAAAVAADGISAGFTFAICSAHGTKDAGQPPASEPTHPSATHTCPVCYSLTPAGNAVGPVAVVAADMGEAPAVLFEPAPIRPAKANPSYGKQSRAPPRVG